MALISHDARQRRLALLALLAAVALAVVAAWPLLHRLYVAQTLFRPATIVQNFTHMADIFPARVVPASGTPRPLPAGTPIALPAQFEAYGRHDTAAYLRDTGTDALLVLQDGKLVFEQYYQGVTPATPHISWSLAKSMISMLIGVAIQEGKIHSVNDPVDRYAPELRGTAYAGVPLRDVLHMASGVKFDENYDNRDADVVKLARTLVLGGSFNAYARNLAREHAPGTHRHYSSFDTQVLAMVLRGATGQTVAGYQQDKLWGPLGAEHDAWWLVDGEGMEMGFGGFNAVARDYARFGQLYLDRGRVGDRQLVPEQWVLDSVRMDAPLLRPQAGQPNELGIGYGYQWWVPEDGARDYMGIGVYNQFIYVSPATRTVIVKNSANARYTSDDFVPIMEHLAMFRAIAAVASRAAAPAIGSATAAAPAAATGQPGASPAPAAAAGAAGNPVPALPLPASRPAAGAR